MKCSLGISDFLEEISSLSHSIVFLYVFALIAEEGFLISSYCSLELCIQMFISFLFSFALHKRGWLRRCTSAAERSYPTSEVRGRSQEDSMPEGRWPRGATPCPRPGAAAGRSYSPTLLKARGGGQEEQPHIQGTVAAQAQEGLEEPSHIEGQEGWQ